MENEDNEIMRYSTVSPQLWLGETAQQLRSEDPSVYLTACYLITSPHSNMIGAYALPVLYAAHEMGLEQSRVTDALGALEGIGFVKVYPKSSFVWVIRMARWQVSKTLRPGDKRRKPIERLLAYLPDDVLADFLGEYGQAWHLNSEGQTDLALAPLKPLSSELATLADVEAWGYARFKALRGDAIPAFRNLLPIPAHELDAVGSTIYAWLGAARAIESYRAEASREVPDPTSGPRGRKRARASAAAVMEILDGES